MGRSHVAGAERRLTSGCLGLAGRLAVGELAADLCDVALTAATRVGIESELDRHVRRRQQGQLLGDVVFIHTRIMNEGCDRVVGSAVEDRVIRVDPDEADLDPLLFQVIERRFEAPHRDRVVDPSVTEVEVERVGGGDVGPGLDQTVERRRAELSGGPDQAERQLGIIDLFDSDRR